MVEGLGQPSPHRVVNVVGGGERDEVDDPGLGDADAPRDPGIFHGPGQDELEGEAAGLRAHLGQLVGPLQRATLSVYVDDVESVFDRAVAAGATPLRAVADQSYGDRTGQFEDPFGHRWSVATHVEDVSPEEMARRAAEQAPGG